MSRQRARARDLGLAPGRLPPGPLNAITDVAGVRVGHVTLIEGDGIRTGATAILPHGGNLHRDRVPAGLAIGNGFGKLAGATQLLELGEIETPIILTNTLAVPEATRAVIDWTLAQPGNEQVVSVNPIVGECNDSWLNDIRSRALTAAHVRGAIDGAVSGPVAGGNVGAGTGTRAFGWKGGIGTASRRLPPDQGGFTVGVLVQSNFGGDLRVLGMAVEWGSAEAAVADGSIMMVLATDAPLSDRNLTRLARRALAGLARTGAAMSNGSGDYAVAFATAETVRRTAKRRQGPAEMIDWPNERMSPLFLAAIEAGEEAIYDSLFLATTMTGYRGRTVQALPLEAVLQALPRGGAPEEVLMHPD